MKTIKLSAASQEFLEGCSKTLIFIKDFLLVAGFESMLPLSPQGGSGRLRPDRHLTQIVFVVTLGSPASCLKGKPLLLNTKLFGGQRHDN